MKKKLSKKVGCLIAALCFVILECSAISAKELPVAITQQTDLKDLRQYDTDGDGLVTAIVIGSESSQTTSGIGIQPLSVVGDNGVRLRNAPNNSATILELMYQGETVSINLDVSDHYPGWYYLYRHKTGTWGYASRLYVLF